MKLQFYALFLVYCFYLVACKPKQGLRSSEAALPEQQGVKKSQDINGPHILFCQLIFYKASPLPKVSVVSAEAVPGVLQTAMTNEEGPVHYAFLNESEQVLAAGKLPNPLYFRIEVADPETKKLSSRVAYRDSAYRLIRIPYQQGMSKLKIAFTDSLNREHILKIAPIYPKKS